MKPIQMIQTFHERYPLIGPAFWTTSIQYYVMQIIAAAAWAMPYSWLHNTISDLGNNACGVYIDRFVCSPLHVQMNISFILLGLTMILGALLIYHEFDKSFGSALGFSFMAIAGIGSILVGLFPENSIRSLHLFGAALPFLIGNLGLLLLGSVLDIPLTLRIYTLFSGMLALLALVLFTTHTYLGLGIGGMERIVVYPQTMWLIIFGIYISRNHMRSLA